MRNQDQLSALIHSMDMNEKRYFKLYNTLQKGSKKYALLFDELAKMKLYDTGALCKNLKISLKQLADDKSYLQKVLLKALRAYDEENDVEMQLMRQYMEGLVLRKRNLHHLASHHVNKVLSRSIELEQFGWFATAFTAQTALKYGTTQAGLTGTEWKILENQSVLFHEQITLQSLFNESMLFNINRKDLSQLKQTLKHPLLQKSPDELLSDSARMHWYLIQNAAQAILYGLGGKGSEYALALKKLFRKNQNLKQLYPSVYVSNYLRMAMSYPYPEGHKALRELNEAMEMLVHPQKINLHSSAVNEFKTTILLQKMNTYAGMEEHHDCIQTGQELLQLPFSARFLYKKRTVYYLLAHSYFVLGVYEKALKYIRLVYQMPKKNRTDLRLYTMMLEMLVQFDLKNYALIPYLAKSAKSWIRSNKLQLLEEETGMLLKWLSLLSGCVSEEARRDNLKLLLKELEGGQNKIFYLQLINLKRWVSKKV